MSTVAPSGHPPSSPPSRIVGGSGKKEGIDSGRKKIAKKLDRGRLAAMYADAVVVVSQR